MFEMFASKVDDGYGGFMYDLKPLGFGLLIAIFLILMAAVALLHNNEQKKAKTFSTKQLVFSAVAMALAMVTSYLKLFDMPMGGSITLFSMMFITLIGYWYGLKIGLTSAIAYGLLQLIVDPYVISIPQMFVDYIFAFGALGLSGFFCNQKNGLIKGYLLGVFGRYVFAVISGLIFFGSYADGTGMSPLVYSITYNGGYIGVEALMSLIVLALPPVTVALGQVKKLALE